MKFDVYGHFQVEVCREANNEWVAYRTALGKRMRLNLAIPREIRTAHDIARYLDDLYHEAARPGQSVTVIAD